MITVDLHMHTLASHGLADVEEMYVAAHKAGLQIIGFSEHSPRPLGYDYPTEYRDTLTKLFPQYLLKVSKLQQAAFEKLAPGADVSATVNLASSSGAVNLPNITNAASLANITNTNLPNITNANLPNLTNAASLASISNANLPHTLVLLGLELDWLPQEQDFMRHTLSQANFDYIIGGIHFLDHWGFDFTPADWQVSPEQCHAYYVQYWQSLAQLANSGLINIIAHPDLIKIFSVAIFSQWIQEDTSLQLINTALEAMADNQIVMEVSSAGLRKPCQEIYPCAKIMQLAKAKHVAISFGSDAHCTNTPGFGFKQLSAYAASFGYTHSHYFVQGEPRIRKF